MMCTVPASVSAQPARGAIEGVWSTTGTTPDHAAWNIEDHLCGWRCLDRAYEIIREALSDPANDSRSLAELQAQMGAAVDAYLDSVLTDEARMRLSAFDPGSDPAIRCARLPLPALLMGPLPWSVEIGEAGVVVHHEEWQLRRRIPFADTPQPGIFPGASWKAMARFEGETLVVETVGIKAAISRSLITSDEATLVERYTPSADPQRLDVELTVIDPRSYREALTFVRPTVSTPGESILDYPPCEAISGQP